MYCINCGVKLAEGTKKCPLCDTAVYHPELSITNARPLYPAEKIPKTKPRSKAFNGAVLILFFIPLLISLISDLQGDMTLDWFGFVAGGLILGYITIALPLWFRSANPVIFVPCDFAAATLFLLYINIVTHGDWFLSFAFPLMGAACIIVSAAITLLRYLRKGRLYIFGGAFMLSGGFVLLTEFLLDLTFNVRFIGWSIYPLAVLFLLGGMMIYLAINTSAREMMERKFFF